MIEAWRGFRGRPAGNAAAERARAAGDLRHRARPSAAALRRWTAARGMSVSVGRLRPCGVLDWKFTVLSHNTIRGAAGAALLNAELLKAQGYLGD